MFGFWFLCFGFWFLFYGFFFFKNFFLFIFSWAIVLGFDLYLVVIQTWNHLMVPTRSTDDLCHWVDPNFRSAAGPYFIHLIQSGLVWVNLKPNLTQLVDILTCDDSPSWNTSSWCVSSILTKHLPCSSQTQIGGMCFLDLGGAMVLEKKSHLYQVHVPFKRSFFNFRCS